MSTEDLAARLQAGIEDDPNYELDFDEPEQDMRTGGHFFDVQGTDGTEYTVLIVRTGL